ncbi:MAG: polyribonucleotide nucleotidyltransferase, partial [Deltaproteobacteria bacterium]
QILHRLIASGKRIDGRRFDEIRPIEAETGWIPRTHGSALFTRGETQAVVTCTLGTSRDEQIIDSLFGESRSRFLLHYNFPPFSVGEVRPMRGPGRREIGHGNLARRAIEPLLPPPETFPYTIRIVSDITESNGSSSMATVCGASLALMDAGVPIVRPVAGIAMGLVKTEAQVAVLSDILGDEDHLGDMDFKVAGTEVGITAVQMDNKLGSLSREILARALEQARLGRLHILGEMAKARATVRETLAPSAPRIVGLKIRPSRIRDLIGPGGSNIQSIQERFGVRVEVDPDGAVRIYADDLASASQASRRIRELTAELEVGKFYRGRVVATKPFGAFVKIFESVEALVPISELDEKRVERTEDVVKKGEEIVVRVEGVDRQGRIVLSRRAALHAGELDIENP